MAACENGPTFEAAACVDGCLGQTLMHDLRRFLPVRPAAYAACLQHFCDCSASSFRARPEWVESQLQRGASAITHLHTAVNTQSLRCSRICGGNRCPTCCTQSTSAWAACRTSKSRMRQTIESQISVVASELIYCLFRFSVEQPHLEASRLHQALQLRMQVQQPRPHHRQGS